VSNYFILIVFCVVVIEFFLRSDALAFVYKMYEQFSRFAKLMSSQYVSDHWKERVIPMYALIIIINALKFLGVLLSIVALFIGLVLLFPDFFNFTTSVFGIMRMLLFSFIYFKVRNKLFQFIYE